MALWEVVETDPVLHKDTNHRHASVPQHRVLFVDKVLPPLYTDDRTILYPPGQRPHAPDRSRYERAELDRRRGAGKATRDLTRVPVQEPRTRWLEVCNAKVGRVDHCRTTVAGDIRRRRPIRGHGATAYPPLCVQDASDGLQATADATFRRDERDAVVLEVPDRVLQAHAIDFLIHRRRVAQLQKVAHAAIQQARAKLKRTIGRPKFGLVAWLPHAEELARECQLAPIKAGRARHAGAEGGRPLKVDNVAIHHKWQDVGVLKIAGADAQELLIGRKHKSCVASGACLPDPYLASHDRH
mmetsp:Transcript_73513/g.204253  ORF Transcript_73513/g.204253 Transcript_73513/m.204253 type:complete len:298 (+) Transcript_73513:1306-2199(+)